MMPLPTIAAIVAGALGAVAVMLTRIAIARRRRRILQERIEELWVFQQGEK